MKIDLNNRMHRRAMAEVYRRRICSSIARQRGFIINPYSFAVAGGDPYWSSVVSLLHFNGSNGSTTFTDQTGKTWTANATAQLVTTSPYVKFGTAGLLITGANACIYTGDATDWDFGSGDFTIEAWCRLGGAPASAAVLLSKHPGGSYSPFTIFLNTNGSIAAYSSGNGTSWGVQITSAASTFAYDAWNHVAFTRSGDSFYGFYNGTQFGSTATMSGALMTNATRVTIGATSANASIWGGYVDDFRVTKGVGRYSSSFTAPTAQFPDS